MRSLRNVLSFSFLLYPPWVFFFLLYLCCTCELCVAEKIKVLPFPYIKYLAEKFVTCFQDLYGSVSILGLKSYLFCEFETVFHQFTNTCQVVHQHLWVIGYWVLSAWVDCEFHHDLRAQYLKWRENIVGQNTPMPNVKGEEEVNHVFYKQNWFFVCSLNTLHKTTIFKYNELVFFCPMSSLLLVVL